MPVGTTLPTGDVAMAYGLEFAHRPVTVNLAAPGPEGRDVEIVSWFLDGQLTLGFGLAERLEVGVALPVALAQRGTGLEGITSSQGATLAETAVRDPRFNVGWAISQWTPAPTLKFWLKSTLDVGLPLGDESGFARDESASMSPSLHLQGELGVLYFGVSGGARLRSTAEFASVRHGHQAALQLGIGTHVTRARVVALQVEAWMLPSLVSQHSEHISGGTFIPAEWLASFRWAFANPMEVFVGGGTQIPLSSQELPQPDGSYARESVAGVGAPAFRTLLGVRISESRDH
jgi:hypothetical protein